LTVSAFSLDLHTERYAISGSVTDKIDISKIQTLDEALAIIILLVARVQKLKEQIAQLSKDSSTSSKPPSSDIVEPPSERRQPGKRKIGGTAGPYC
jgi:hypothetical protein